MIKINFIDGLNDWDKMIQLEGGFMYRKDVPPGSAQWVTCVGANKQEARYLYFTCPCGCGQCGPLPIISPGRSDGWSWNGSIDKPTTNPSIQKLTPCRWHGYLVGGVFTSC